MIEADLTKLSDPIIPDHELIRRIGRGSYGEVWLARSLLGEFRAVKIVRQDGRHEDRPFQREFEGLQKFEPISRSHAGLVHVLHAGRFAEGFFYLMELADDAKDPSSKGDDIRRLTSKREPEEGRSLVTSSPTMEDYVPRTLRHDLHQRQRLQVSECLRIALKLTEALSHLHEHGLVHRDIKPSNIIFVNGQPKLADIGLVARADATLSFVGTEGYLPPEGPGRAQADIYSLGKVLYEISTGRDRTDFPELPTLLRDDPERQELEEFNEVILKACDPDARRRYPSAQAMHADLVLMQSGQSLRWARAMQRRLVFAKKAGALVAAIALLAATGYLYQQSQTREARRLAGAESVQRARAENLLTIMELKEAESLFEKDEAGMGAAYLARVVRQNPTNQIAASRLMSALMDRSFALPIQTFKSQELMGAELSPDGRFLVSWGGGASNGVAQILDSASGLVIGKPMLHSARFWRARFSPDGRLIGTIAADGAARIWNAATGEPLGETIPHPGLSQSKWGGFLPTSEWIAFSPNSELMVVQDRNEAVVWNVRAGQLFVRRLDHGRNISDLSFSPDGQQIATSRYPEVRLWDTATGKLQQTLRVMDGTEIVTRFSPDGLRVVVASGFNSEVWDVKNGQCLLQLNHDGLVSSARFSPDGLRILTCADNRDVRLWDARSGGLIARPLKHGTEVVDAQFDSTGERILTREARRSRLWDSRTGRPLTEWMLHSEPIQAAQFTPDGKQILVALAGNIIFWDIRPGQALNLALRHPALVPTAKFSPDGTLAVTAAGGDVFNWARNSGCYEAAVWDARSGEIIGKRITLTADAQYAEFSSDGRRIVTASHNGEAQVWDAMTGVAVTEPMKHDDWVNTAVFSADGKMILTASYDKTARIWDAQTGQPLTKSLEHTHTVASAEFSPDGLSVLTLSRSEARIWDVQTGLAKGEGLSGSAKHTTAASFSPDGQRVIIGAADGLASIWDIASRKMIGQPLKHQGKILSIRFSSDNRYIVTASEDQSARIWDALSGKPVGTPLLHAGPVITAQFSRDNRRVVTASADDTARVWDAQTGRPLTEPLREGDMVNYGEFSPDGRRVILGTGDELARIWELPPAGLRSPDWLPDLAEAIAGARWTEGETLEMVPPEQFLSLRSKLLKNPDPDAQSLWMKWLLADRSDRTVSYASSQSASTYLRLLLEDKQIRRIREALHLSPENPAVIARLARRILEKTTPYTSPHKQEEANFLSQRVTWLAPDDPLVWRLRAEILEKIGREEEAASAKERATALKIPTQ